MEILRDIKQIEEKLIKIFNFNIEIDAEKFIKNNLNDEELKYLTDNINDVTKDNLAVNEFSDLIFQLKNYMPALSNFVKLLLITKNYDSVFTFVKKIFVGQVGQIKYTSTKEEKGEENEKE